MNPEIKKRWIDALRSGDYKQTTSKLHTDVGGKDKFCCLGVLCDIVKDEVEGLVITKSSSLNGSIYNYSGSAAYPPDVVTSYVGLSENDTYAFTVEHEGYRVQLYNLNDSQGKTFEEIADLIEKDDVL